MVNGTTYAKKLRLNTRNGNRVIDIEKYIALLQTIDIANNMTIHIYNNTVICLYGNMDINNGIGCRTLSEWSYRPCGRGRKWASFSQWSMDNVQLLRKRTSLTFWWQPGKCAASVVWGVVRNAPGGMFDLSPLLLWSEEHLYFWAVSPCLRNTQATSCMERTGEREQYQYRYVDIPIYPYRYK